MPRGWGGLSRLRARGRLPLYEVTFRNETSRWAERLEAFDWQPTEEQKQNVVQFFANDARLSGLLFSAIQESTALLVSGT
jgi:hypothetical protein